MGNVVSIDTVTGERTRNGVPEERARRFVLFPARAYVHVAEYLSNGQLTARWSKRKSDGAWFMQAGWGRAQTRGGRIGRSQVADIERLIAGAPTEQQETERLVALIGRMREEDREFITPETVAEFGGVCTIRAREALRLVFGEAWLARQDAATG
jgi:hypothetical protein